MMRDRTPQRTPGRQGRTSQGPDVRLKDGSAQVVIWLRESDRGVRTFGAVPEIRYQIEENTWRNRQSLNSTGEIALIQKLLSIAYNIGLAWVMSDTFLEGAVLREDIIRRYAPGRAILSGR